MDFLAIEYKLLCFHLDIIWVLLILHIMKNLQNTSVCLWAYRDIGKMKLLDLD